MMLFFWEIKCGSLKAVKPVKQEFFEIKLRQKTVSSKAFGKYFVSFTKLAFSSDIMAFNRSYTFVVFVLIFGQMISITAGKF